MQKNRIVILSTKSLDSELITRAEAHGILLEELSFVRTEGISSPKMRKKINDVSRSPGIVVFTSKNAVEIVATELGRNKPDPVAVGWKIFCLGYATRQLVEKYFQKELIGGTAQNARKLAEIIVHKKIQKIIFFSGDQRRNELPDLLREADIGVDEIVVYQTIVTPQRIERTYDGILFFSPSAVKSFFEKNKLESRTVLFAIGNTTADEIRRFLPAVRKDLKNKIIVSDEPEAELLLHKAIHYFQMNRIHH